jgi:hypothetical protein
MRSPQPIPSYHSGRVNRAVPTMPSRKLMSPRKGQMAETLANGSQRRDGDIDALLNTVAAGGTAAASSSGLLATPPVTFTPPNMYTLSSPPARVTDKVQSVQSTPTKLRGNGEQAHLFVALYESSTDRRQPLRSIRVDLCAVVRHSSWSRPSAAPTPTGLAARWLISRAATLRPTMSSMKIVCRTFLLVARQTLNAKPRLPRTRCRPS